MALSLITGRWLEIPGVGSASGIRGLYEYDLGHGKGCRRICG